MTPHELLEEIKEGLPASAWSNAVLAVRRGEVALFHREGGRYIYDVLMGRTLPYRVELDLEDGDWSCPCNAPMGTCAHAAAAAIALHHAEKSGHAPTPTARPPAEARHLRHRIRVTGDRWELDSVLVDPARSQEELPLPAVLPPEVQLTPGDREVRALIDAGITRERLMALLRALALCPDVTVEGRPVKVSPESVPSFLLVEDHAQGLRVRLGPREKLHHSLPGPLELVVVGDPPTLRPLARSNLSQDQIDFFRQGRIYTRGEQMARFFSDILPRMQTRTLVELRTKSAPKVTVMRPYARLTLWLADGGLDALATVTYGHPPQAVVVGDRIHLLEGATQTPERLPNEERRLASMIQAVVGEEPGRRMRLRGALAARFASEVIPRFERKGGRLENREVAERVRIHDAPLKPRWIVDPATGKPAMLFVLEPQAGRTGAGGAEGPGSGSRAGSAAGPQPLPTGRASLEEVLAAWREGRALLPLLDGGFARLPADWMDKNGALVEALLEASEDRPESWRAPLMARLMEEAETTPDVARIKQALLERQTIRPVAVPPGLEARLRGYQQEGLAWLAHLETQGLGGILADDMGLGKTLQTLALLLTDPAEAGPTLVVAPTSVLDNWAQEAARFAPRLSVELYHGGGRSAERLEHRDLVITSYAILRRDLETLRHVPWHRVILDEAQAIKNPDSLSAKAARVLRDGAERRALALTGTPVENRLQELWSLLEFLNPGMLGDRSRFEERYGRPAAGGDPRAVAQLRARVQPFILRRLKQEVARDLPPKTEVVVKAHLTPAERAVYEAVRIAGQREVRRLIRSQGMAKSRLQILEVLLRLRQAACHPGLVPGAGKAGQEAGSSKLKLLMQQLEVVLAEGHKALVFSQWTSLLDRVEPVLKQAAIPWVRLDGSTRDRAGVVARFQDEKGPGVFLISLKAGGTGLNLTAADYVYHLDPWWNPAVEDQATDRAYRIGQTRPVVATKLIAAKTVEERVLLLQERKRAVAEAALGGGGEWIGTLGEDELEALLEE